MPRTLLITLTLAEQDTGPFDLYCISSTGTVSNSAFETNISKSALVNGYVTSLIPDSCKKVRVKSNNSICNNYVDLPTPP
jgi:hypothetical protein